MKNNSMTKTSILILIQALALNILCFAQFNPPFTNGPWPGRTLPTPENPVAGMGGFVHDSIYSNACHHQIGYCVVLPKSYFKPENSGTQWPVIYFLHGYTGYETADVWNANFYFQKTEKDSFPEVIMVFPNGMNEWYADNANGKLGIETHIIKELLPFIDKTYRTKPGCRSIVGFSMGGYGAIKYYLKYPELFNSAVSIDGSLYHPQSPMRDYYKPVFGTTDNYTKNSVFTLLDECLEKHKGIEKRLKIMILQNEHEDPDRQNFSEYLTEKQVQHLYFNAPLAHDATLFYNKYIDQILGFESANLCNLPLK
jgi:predicted alpha/beta superfamily hydrolase